MTKVMVHRRQGEFVKLYSIQRRSIFAQFTRPLTNVVQNFGYHRQTCTQLPALIKYVSGLAKSAGKFLLNINLICEICIWPKIKCSLIRKGFYLFIIQGSHYVRQIITLFRVPKSSNYKLPTSS